MDEIPPPPINNQLEYTIPYELIAIILSFLPVKTISRFGCVSKSWKTLISDPYFIQMHLQKSSSRNPNFILKPFLNEYPINTIVSLPVSRVLHNHPSITLSGNTYPSFSLLKGDDNCSVVGSCNGLLCLMFKSHSTNLCKFSFRLWNPATGTISEQFGFVSENKPLSGIFNCSFGCDCLTGTFKLVWFHSDYTQGIWKSNVRVLSLNGDKCGWRNISSPIICTKGVHLNGTLNWLTLRWMKHSNPHVSFFWIASLDLSTETYTQLLFPEGFKELPYFSTPDIRVLLDCLCFSHDCKKTEFVIWQMKEFGVKESWAQLFRIKYFDLPIKSPLLPLYVSKNGDTVILTNKEDDKAIIYNQRDKRVVRTIISNGFHWISAIDYVESLVPTPWK